MWEGLLITRQHSSWKCYYLGGAGGSHLLGSLGEIYPHIGGCPSFDTLFPIWISKRHGHWTRRQDQVKPKYSMAAITTSRSSGTLTYATWQRFFDEGDASCTNFVVEAVLAYWLSCYVLSSGLEDGLKQYDFPLEIQIAKDVKFSLVLRIIILDAGWVHRQYHLGRYNLVTHADSCFLLKFVRERYPVISPKSMAFPAVITEEVALTDDSKKIKSIGTHKPCAWRWINSKHLPVSPWQMWSTRRKTSASGFLLYTSRHVHSFYFWRIRRGVQVSPKRTMNRKTTVFIACNYSPHLSFVQDWVQGRIN